MLSVLGVVPPIFLASVYQGNVHTVITQQAIIRSEFAHIFIIIGRYPFWVSASFLLHIGNYTEN